MEAVLSLLSTPNLSLKLVRPKALLDNCFRVMELLYCSCCKGLPVGGAGNCRPRDLGPGVWSESTLSWGCPLIDRLFPEAGLGPEFGDKSVWFRCSALQALFFFFSFLSLAGKQSSILKWQDCELPRLHPHSPGSLMQCTATNVYPLPRQTPTSLPRSPSSSHGPLP